MSKSYGNTILLTRPGTGDTSEIEDHGDRSGAGKAQRSWRPRCMPGGRSAQSLFDPRHIAQKVYAGCRSAGIGCRSSARAGAADAIVAEVEPRCNKRRKKYEDQPRLVHDILHSGSELARARAEETMERVREAMHLVQPEAGERAQ